MTRVIYTEAMCNNSSGNESHKRLTAWDAHARALASPIETQQYISHNGKYDGGTDRYTNHHECRTPFLRQSLCRRVSFAHTVQKMSF